MSKAEQHKEWEARIAELESSGQSIVTWCSNNNYKVGQTKYWLRKFKKGGQPPTKAANWLSVEISESKYEHKVTPLKVKVGTAIIEVESDFNAELLLNVVRALSVTC